MATANRDESCAVPRAVIGHASTGRLRLSLPEVKGNRALFESLCDAAVRLTGVREAEARLRTGSLILTHDMSTEELIAALRERNLVELTEPAAPEDPGTSFAAWRDEVEAFVRQHGGAAASVRSTAALAFFAMAIAQLARGQLMPPAATALWYGISLLLAGRADASVGEPGGHGSGGPAGGDD